MPVNSAFSAANVMTVSLEGLKEAQDQLAAATDAVNPSGGLRSTLTLATGMVHRYVISLGADHPPIEQTGVLPVWSGRLKNSLFFVVERRGGDLVGRVTSNLAYGPKVESRRGFMAKGAEDMQGPVTDLIAADISTKITRKS